MIPPISPSNPPPKSVAWAIGNFFNYLISRICDLFLRIFSSKIPQEFAIDPKRQRAYSDLSNVSSATATPIVQKTENVAYDSLSIESHYAIVKISQILRTLKPGTLRHSQEALLAFSSTKGLKPPEFKEIVQLLLMDHSSLFSGLKDLILEGTQTLETRQKVIKLYLSEMSQENQRGFLSSLSQTIADPLKEKSRILAVSILETALIDHTSTLKLEQDTASLLHPEFAPVFNGSYSEGSSAYSLAECFITLKNYPLLQKKIIEELKDTQLKSLIKDLALSIDTLTFDPFSACFIKVVSEKLGQNLDQSLLKPEDFVKLITKLPQEATGFSQFLNLFNLETQNLVFEAIKAKKENTSEFKNLVSKFEQLILKNYTGDESKREALEKKYFDSFYPSISKSLEKFSTLRPYKKGALLLFFEKNSKSYKIHAEKLLQKLTKDDFLEVFDSLSRLKELKVDISLFLSQKLLDAADRVFGYNFTETVCEKIYQAQGSQLLPDQLKKIAALSEFDRYLVTQFAFKHVKSDPKLFLDCLSLLNLFGVSKDTRDDLIQQTLETVKTLKAANEWPSIYLFPRELRDEPELKAACMTYGDRIKILEDILSPRHLSDALKKVSSFKDFPDIKSERLEWFVDKTFDDLFQQSQNTQGALKIIKEDILSVQAALQEISYLPRVHHLFEDSDYYDDIFSARVKKEEVLKRRQLEKTSLELAQTHGPLEAQEERLLESLPAIIHGLSLELEKMDQRLSVYKKFYSEIHERHLTMPEFRQYAKFKLDLLKAKLLILETIQEAKKDTERTTLEIKAEDAAPFRLSTEFTPNHFTLNILIYGVSSFKPLLLDSKIYQDMDHKNQAILIKNLCKGLSQKDLQALRQLLIEARLPPYNPAIKLIDQRLGFNDIFVFEEGKRRLETRAISLMTEAKLQETISTIENSYPEEREAWLFCQDYLNAMRYVSGTLKDQPLYEACFANHHINKILIKNLNPEQLGALESYLQKIQDGAQVPQTMIERFMGAFRQAKDTPLDEALSFVKKTLPEKKSLTE